MGFVDIEAQEGRVSSVRAGWLPPYEGTPVDSPSSILDRLTEELIQPQEPES